MALHVIWTLSKRHRPWDLNLQRVMALLSTSISKITSSHLVRDELCEWRIIKSLWQEASVTYSTCDSEAPASFHSWWWPWHLNSALFSLAAKELCAHRTILSLLVPCLIELWEFTRLTPRGGCRVGAQHTPDCLPRLRSRGSVLVALRLLWWQAPDKENKTELCSPQIKKKKKGLSVGQNSS